jgi:signal peptidase I
MSKTKPIINVKTPSSPPAKRFFARHAPNAASIRETIESIAIAFILAFLFRTFEAEAFVIPTGSMAPTLMGRHKDLTCAKCGFPYQVNASEEVERDGRPKDFDDPVVSSTCPICRYTMKIDGKQNPSYSGDRIIVNKFSYQFNDPKRWDVIVFYYPEGARDNYIKRLAGLPNETLRIHLGDVWIQKTASKSDGPQEFKIARKPPEKVLAMLQMVFDNDYMPAIAKYGWPARWQNDAGSKNAAGEWTSDDFASFQTDGKSSGEAWLRYRHLVPSYAQWHSLGPAGPLGQNPVESQLITDFTAYNTGRKLFESNLSMAPTADLLGLHWVGDLALSATVELESDKGQTVLELVKGGRRFQCRLDAATGQASLSISGEGMKGFRPTAQTEFRGPGRYKLIFSNCDRQLLLWINDKAVKFDADTSYGDLGNARPTREDLAPAGVASAGAKMRLGHLKVMRDIYYIAVDRTMNVLNDYINVPPLLAAGETERFFSDPSQWGAFDEPNMRQVDFRLGANQYFALGDNSAKSRDSRLWIDERGKNKYWIERDLLKGKALFIYWPHSWNRIPYVNIPFPYFPNFGRMHFIE